MAWKRNRPRPTAQFLGFNSNPSGAEAKCQELDRYILLRTGRGDVRISPEEAVILIQELRTAAEKARQIISQSVSGQPSQ